MFFAEHRWQLCCNGTEKCSQYLRFKCECECRGSLSLCSCYYEGNKLQKRNIYRELSMLRCVGLLDLHYFGLDFVSSYRYNKNCRWWTLFLFFFKPFATLFTLEFYLTSPVTPPLPPHLFSVSYWSLFLIIKMMKKGLVRISLERITNIKKLKAAEIPSQKRSSRKFTVFTACIIQLRWSQGSSPATSWAFVVWHFKLHYILTPAICLLLPRPVSIIATTLSALCSQPGPVKAHQSSGYI